MTRISPASRCSRRVPQERRTGFTFTEILVSLTVLIIIAATVFLTHSRILRAQAELRALEEAVLISQQIAAETWLGTPADDTLAAVQEDGKWQIEMDTVPFETSRGKIVWDVWQVSPSDKRISKTTVLYLRSRHGGADEQNQS